jgi:hypothetical protein
LFVSNFFGAKNVHESLFIENIHCKSFVTQDMRNVNNRPETLTQSLTSYMNALHFIFDLMAKQYENQKFKRNEGGQGESNAGSS